MRRAWPCRLPASWLVVPRVIGPAVSPTFHTRWCGPVVSGGRFRRAAPAWPAAGALTKSVVNRLGLLLVPENAFRGVLAPLRPGELATAAVAASAALKRAPKMNETT